MMLELLGTAVSSVLSGGATGLLGVVAQRYADYKNRELDIQLQAQQHLHELAMRDKDAAMLDKEWAGKIQIAETEARSAVDKSDADAFAGSYALEPQRYSTGTFSKGQQWMLVLLDVFRGSVRPALTVYLCALTTMIYIQSRALLAAEDLSTADALGITQLIVGTILYLTTTVTLWWFGTRNKHQPPRT